VVGPLCRAFNSRSRHRRPDETPGRDSNVARFALAGLALVLLLGCSNPTTRPSASPGSPTAIPPRQILCDVHEAHITSASFPSFATDVVVGSISWPELKTWATADPSGFRAGGSESDYKIGAQVKAGATVTVSVSPEARAYAGLDYGQASHYSPTSAVTFHACATADTAFIGGFHVVGKHCVPFDVSEDRKPSIRTVISFFNGPCSGV
jgi:hypothetical protein